LGTAWGPSHLLFLNKPLGDELIRWVSYPRAERILSRLDDLLYLPARVRMQNVLIHGVSGAGKSTINEKFIHVRRARAASAES
jgi:hypothetical protein